MSLKLDVENFRNLRNVHVDDAGKVSLFVGYNEAGKSSLVNAIRFAFTGEAYGYRGKQVVGLISHGETRLNVKVRVGPHFVSRTTSGGDPVKGIAERLGVPLEVLPLLFDAKMAGDGGNKHLKAFLAGMTASRFDAAAAFADKPVVAACIAEVQRMGANTTKAIIEGCERNRAASKAPSPPLKPTVPRPAANDVEGARAAEHAVRQAQQAALADQQELQSLYTRIVVLGSHLAAKEEYDRLMEERSAQSSLAPEERRHAELVAGINAGALKAAADLLTNSPFCKDANPLKAAHALVTSASAAARALLDKNPLRNMPKLPEQKDPEIVREIMEKHGAVTAPILKTMSDQALLLLADSRTTLARLTTQGAADTNRVQELTKALGAWEAYDAAQPTYVLAKERAEAEWDRWDLAAKSIAAAELEYQRTQGDRFGEMTAAMSAGVLNGRVLKIDPAEGIFLGDTPINDISTATQWRVEISLMAAIARTMSSPILLIDGLDILDVNNRATMNKFIVERIVPHFEHVILATTPRGDIKDELPSTVNGMTKYIIEAGNVRVLQSQTQPAVV